MKTISTRSGSFLLLKVFLIDVPSGRVLPLFKDVILYKISNCEKKTEELLQKSKQFANKIMRATLVKKMCSKLHQTKTMLNMGSRQISVNKLTGDP